MKRLMILIIGLILLPAMATTTPNPLAAIQQMNQMPLAFTKNMGQWDERGRGLLARRFATQARREMTNYMRIDPSASEDSLQQSAEMLMPELSLRPEYQVPEIDPPYSNVYKLRKRSRELDNLNQPPVLRNDFLVNDDTVGSCYHATGDVSSSPDGRSVVLWLDGRGGSDLFAQIYAPGGQSVGNNVGLGTSRGWEDARVAMADDGSFVTLLESSIYPYDTIYAMRYSSEGQPLGQEIMVGTTGYSLTDLFDVATDPSGNFVVAWLEQQWPDTSVAVMLRWFTAGGVPLTAALRADDSTPSVKREPCIAMNNTGYVWVAWDDRRSNNWDVYAQGFLYANKIGGNIRVNDDGSARSQYFPNVASDRHDRFRFAWYDFRDSVKDVYVQSITAGGALVGQNVKANPQPAISSHGTPAIGSLSGGDFFVGWYPLANPGAPAIRRFASNGQGSETFLSLCGDSTSSMWPLLLAGSDSSLLVAWKGYRTAEWKEGIEAQLFGENNLPLTDCFWVSDDDGSSSQELPALAIDATGATVVTWMDSRYLQNRIFEQVYGDQGLPVGPNLQVDTLSNRLSAWAENPSAARNCDGTTVITWLQTYYYNYSNRVMVRVLDSSGSPLGWPFDVSEFHGGGLWWRARVSSNCEKGFVVTWSDVRAGSYDVYCQLLDKLGQPIGNNWKVNSFSSTDQQPFSDVAFAPAGVILVVWDDIRDGLYDWNIYGQLYDSSVNPIGGNFRINDPGNRGMQVAPTVASDSMGNFVVVWLDDRNFIGENSWDNYGQRISPAGELLGVNFKLNDVGSGGDSYGPQVAMKSDGGFVTAWTYDPTDPLSMRVREFDRLGIPTSPSFPVIDPSITWGIRQNVAVALSKNKMILAWEDSRRAKGLDIYAKIYAEYICGDANGSGSIDIADVVFLINYIFAGGPAPSPYASGDADCDGVITIADAVYLIEYIFSHGAAPCAGCK